MLHPLSAGDRDLFVSVEQRDGKHSRPLHKSFDCSIMDLADDISFGVHDLEDALALRLVNEDDFRELVPKNDCLSFLEELSDKYPKERSNDPYGKLIEALFADGQTRKHWISRIVGYLIMNCGIDTLDEFDEPLLRFRAILMPGPRTFLDALTTLVRQRVILDPSVQHLEFKGQHMVVSVFETMSTEPEAFLPRDTFELYEKRGADVRVICDHIAGM
ncbi:MAG TPA: dGTPase, partial [Phycisphaerales bacterium]|nr:dGTPase [Phycisphaerales bacterium]